MISLIIGIICLVILLNLKKIFVVITLFLGLCYLGILEFFRYIKSLFSKKRYKNMIEESLEENDPEQYFLGLVKELHYRINKPEFNDVLKSMLNGYNKEAFTELKLDNKVNKKQVQIGFMSLLFMHLFLCVRDAESEEYSKNIILCLDEIEKFVNEYEITDPETGKIYNIPELKKELTELAETDE